MKLYIFFILLFVKIAGAQRFNAFLSGGISMSQVSGDQLGGFDKAGVYAGAGVITPIAARTALAFETGYIQKGSRKPSKLDQGDVSYYRLRLNYLEPCIYINYYMKEKFTLYAGGAAGVLIASSEENENGEVPYNIAFEKYDVSMMGGLQFNAGNYWKFNIRGIQSVLPVREYGGQAIPFFDGGQYNSVIVLILNYYFRSTENERR